MIYSDAIKYLYSQLPMYQRSGPIAYKNNLNNTRALDKMFNGPHKNFRSIHVGGTNGKGSVSHMLASVLQSAGYKVGLYTSPHLKDFRERIRINGEMISEEAVCTFMDKFLCSNEEVKLEPSFFELTVTMAFDYFSKSKVDFAVVEVGLGGRLDSTNIISPDLSIITNISFDHTNLLGGTLLEIAGEKAGVIKANTPILIGETQVEVQSVFAHRAEALNAPLFFADSDFTINNISNGKFDIAKNDEVLYRNLKCDLGGDYQHKNLITVIAALQILQEKGLNISNDDVFDGLGNVAVKTGLMGRWQELAQYPTIICDTAHNEAGIGWVVRQLKKQKFKNLHIVFGTVNDKDISKVLALLPKRAIYYFTRAQIDRAYNENKLRDDAALYGLRGEAYPNVEIALQTAKKTALADDFIFVGGSTFIVAEVV